MHFVDVLTVGKDLLKANKKNADKNRNLLKENNVVAFDFMGAIGSGKTLLIEKLIENLKGDYNVACIAGDVIAKFDAGRMEKHGAKVIPLNTGKECHLDAHQIGHSLGDLDLKDIDIVFIENVGNLICPTDFDLGTHKRIVVVSATEGDDTVEKHPEIFKTANLTIINKIDLAEAVEADPKKMEADAKIINPEMDVLLTAVKKDIGFDEVANYIRTNINEKRN
ncbi:hydrogenase nickel incorporation protein HypB [Methanococcus voltae]|uniref:Hydrogenase nickel incorporation protein HypB n=2 Tax=Methanococcus voltae TaxID=2188 RepID=A0A8J7REN1_METVO|nr:hydrogenase nickel incorporation protein HypB [Methanococcus voltae]MBP2172255.1 hydrogenase nickel incorporation protein HypB [Methanococcus voltae]MBP2200789.1 hydrogenase nickel incorporation protein HypB [Methanococcus voltae]MCS3921513.1 hydrogenase nickel incorporation protein HypB [Methanococcus voltae PS]